MMDVQAFVRDTITQIIAGIKEADEVSRSVGAYVNPHVRKHGAGGSSDHASVFGYMSDNGVVFAVDFDLAITVAQERGVSGGFKAVIASVGFGVDGARKEQESRVSRVRFQVPVRFPIAKTEPLVGT